MPPTADELGENAAAALDDNNPNPTPAPEPPTDPTPPKVPDDPTPDKGKKPEADEGFTADEVTPEAEPEVHQPAPEPAKIDTSGLNEEQRYIVDKLPLITTRVKDGEGFKDVQVKSWTQLPNDVEFASKRDELAFVNAITAQENRAKELQTEFQTNQRASETKKFEQAEDDAIWSDIAELQGEGRMAKFTGDKADPSFKSDTDAKHMEDVLSYMRGQNENYLKATNERGAPFRHIGFREAFFMYNQQNPNKTPPARREDDERLTIADRLQGNRGLNVSQISKPTIHSGTTTQQLLAHIDSLDI